MCILLVEDEFLIRVIVAEELVEAGFEVREAEDGDQAAAMIQTRPDVFSLLITDIHMPGDRDGIELACLVREHRPDLPVIFMTGRPDALDGGGHLGDRSALVEKPFAPSELLAVVRELLG